MQVWLLVNTGENAPVGAVEMDRAYLLDVQAGQTPTQAAAAFANNQNFPVGTKATLVDLSQVPAAALVSFQLQAEWVGI